MEKGELSMCAAVKRLLKLVKSALDVALRKTDVTTVIDYY